jgi:hypothetical protein
MEDSEFWLLTSSNAERGLVRDATTRSRSGVLNCGCFVGWGDRVDNDNNDNNDNNDVRVTGKTPQTSTHSKKERTETATGFTRRNCLQPSMTVLCTRHTKPVQQTSTRGVAGNALESTSFLTGDWDS